MRSAIRLENGHVRLENGHVRLENGHIRLEDGHVRLEDGHVRLEDGYIRLEVGYVFPGPDHLDSDVVDSVVEHPHARENRDKRRRDCPLEESNLAGEHSELVGMIKLGHDRGGGRLDRHRFRHRIATPGISLPELYAGPPTAQ